MYVFFAYSLLSRPFSDVVGLAATKQDTEPAGTIEFNNVGVGFDDKFTIISTRGIFEFQVENAEDHAQWTKVLVRVLSSINK